MMHLIKLYEILRIYIRRPGQFNIKRSYRRYRGEYISCVGFKMAADEGGVRLRHETADGTLFYVC